MVVAGTANVGVQDRRIVRGARRRSGLEPVLEDGGDALVIERADLDRTGGDRLRSGGINAPIETQDAKAGTEALLRMWPSGQHGDDQRLGVGTDRPSLALEAFGVPLGVEPVRARHVVGQGAVPWAAIASGVRGNALTAVEHLHRALGQPCLDLLADQTVRDGVEEPGGFDVIVDADPGKCPIGILVVGVGQRSHDRSLDGFNNSRRLTPRRRITRPFSSTSILVIAALHSASEKNFRLRNLPSR